jgi:hypothetical protein
MSDQAAQLRGARRFTLETRRQPVRTNAVSYNRLDMRCAEAEDAPDRKQ